MKNHRHHFRQLFSHAAILAFLFLVPASMAVAWDGVSIAETNYQGLLAFKNALLDPGGYLRGWNGTGLDACSGAWEGIKCAQGQVIVIQLPWHGLGGTISDKLGQLTGLRKLNLHDNVLQGHIPSAIGLLPDLRGVYLFNNRLSGAIPPSIGNCLHLQTLDLSNNLLSGTIPSSISNSSTSLYRLNLSHNKLVGSIPAVFTNLPSLTFLSLHFNNLSGSIPDTWGGGSNPTHLIQVLNLDGNSISGTIPTSLSTLPSLQELTLSNNDISGTIPKELGKLLMLQRLDLSNNSITGNIPDSLCNISSLLQLNLEGNRLENKIPDAIDGLKNLAFLSLKRNQLEGLIPPAIGNFANLSTLDLSDNNLTGEIPTSLVKLTALSGFNVSNNNLSGAVPHILAEKFNSSSFRGNIQLCGYAPSVPCSSSTSSPSPSPEIAPVIAPTKRPGTRKGLSVGRVVVLVALACAALLVVLCCVLLVCCLIRKRKVLSKKSVPGATTAAGRKSGSGGGPEAEVGGDAPAGKLVHFDGPLGFTADDLLCATAEIMGKTSYGTVYKASLEDGNQVAVKRLREKISKNQKEFEAEVATLGKIRHPNLLPLRAYYLGPKGEKLLVFDYLPKGTLATFLHARGPDTPIDWGTRMKIATGIGRGLLHLHTHENIVHGGMTSANVLLDEGLNPRISDYGLSRLMTSAAPTTSAVATAGSLGYRAPEMTKQKKATTKADVYSLGVVMLELLTGKSPGEAVNGLDLPQWVASIGEEDWKSEVFDLELSKDGGAATQDEMLSVLKVALYCVDPSPSSRPEVDHLLRQLEEIMPELKEEDEEEVGGGDGGGGGGMEHEGSSEGAYH